MKHQHLVGMVSSIVLIASSVGMSSAHAVTFTPPAGGGPSQSTGGASRGTIKFTPPPKNAAPRQSTGGASRGNLFQPAAGTSAPSQTTGGASRGQLFKPAPNNSAPKRAAGGASRGNLFGTGSAPSQAAGGASRGQLLGSGQGAPNQAAGGASRNGIHPVDPATVGATGPAALIAVLPQTFYGTTVAERPTILAYLPASTADQAVFSLKDEAGNTLHEMIVPVSGEAGIRAIKLPAGAPALAVGKNYQWFLALKVDGVLNPSTPYIDGWIQRVPPSATLVSALQQPDALQQAKALGANGVWYDCVATLAAMHTAPGAKAPLAKDWAELLTSVGLQDIVQAPIMLATN